MVVSGWDKRYMVYLCSDENVLQLTVVMIAQPVSTLKTNKLYTMSALYEWIIFQ